MLNTKNNSSRSLRHLRKSVCRRLCLSEKTWLYRADFTIILAVALILMSCVASPVDTSLQQVDDAGSGGSQYQSEAAANDKSCAYFYYLWGKTAEHNGRFDEALEAYEKAILCDEESRKLKQSLAILLIRMDRKDKAAGILEQIIKSDPQDRENRVLLAKVYRSMGLAEKAAAIYQNLLKIEEDHDTLLMLGTLYAQNKEYDKAQKVLNRLIQLEGDSYLAHYSLARLYRELQYYDKAASAYEKALELNWFERLAYEVAEFYEERQLYEKAIVVYNRIIEEGQSSEVAKTKLVNLYLTLEEDDKALKLLRDLRSVMPESHNVDITISRILLNQEKYEEAVMILEDVLQTNPELTVVRYLLGMAYYRIQNYQKAVEHLQMIPLESSLFEDTVFLRLKILNEEGREAEAIKLLEQQVRDPAARKASFFVLLASLYHEKQENEAGRAIYQQALELYPEDVDLHYNYGIFLEKIGEQVQAMEIMQKVLGLDPDNGAALNYVGYTWADNNVHLEQALEYIQKAVQLMPDNGYVRDSLGWVLYKLGDAEQAVIELETAAEMVADDPIIREHLGDVYLETGQLEKALSAYQKALELYEDDDKKALVNKKIMSIRSGSDK